jgi:hypothetical protein
MALVRLAALVGAAYLLVAVVLELAAATTAHRRAPDRPDRLDRLVHPAARRLVRALAGIGLATSVTAAALVGPAAATTPLGRVAHAATAPPVMRRLDPAPDPAPPGTPPTMRRLDGAPTTIPTSTTSTTSTTTSPPPTTPPPISGSADSGSTPSPPSATWTIAPGDHLWHVAEATLTAATGQVPDDAETERYLVRLIDRNRSVLIVPGDADLVRPGQVFALPPVG